MDVSREKVLLIQKNINKAIERGIISIPVLVVDGIMGPKTKEAIFKLQAFLNLEKTSEYDLATSLELARKLGTYYIRDTESITTSLKSSDFDGLLTNKEILIKEALISGVNNRNELAMLLAQMHHESMGFTRLVESFNYRADRLFVVFPKYFPTMQDAVRAVSKGQEYIGNVVYGNRMGNASDEGFKYRGRGFIQLTGKNNYKRYSELSGLDLVNSPDLLVVPENAAKISLLYWIHTDGIRSNAKKGDVKKVTRIINGGLNGLEDRKRLFSEYLKEV